MELELEVGLKITQPREDLTTHFFFSTEEGNNPPFKYTETNTMFLLIANLPGFKNNQINIQIDRTGTRISVSGEKWVQEMVMVRWQMCKKDPRIKSFRRVFRIPDGIVLDHIQAKFDELDSILTIFMPKSKKGIWGIKIEEILEKDEEKEQEINGTSIERETIANNVDKDIPKCPERDGFNDREIVEESKELKMENREETDSLKQIQEMSETEREKEPEERLDQEVPLLRIAPMPETHVPTTPDIAPRTETPKIQDSNEVDKNHQMKKFEEIQDVNLPELKFQDFDSTAESDAKLPEVETPKKVETEKIVEEHKSEEHEGVHVPQLSEPAPETLDSMEAESNIKETTNAASPGRKLEIPKAEMEIEEVGDDRGRNVGEDMGIPQKEAEIKERSDQGAELEEGKEEKLDHQSKEISNNRERKGRHYNKRFCNPCCLFVGSTFVISLVVIVIHLIKDKRSNRAIHDKRD
ncbi:uncharacterized protein LOC131230202 [Magnolia sinica]|uniref:uncharacterized protein LOC131230202 n=1 Tax=Magnolia sinica TaxID=86752 RepID=UPI00265A42A6|nr:uncharacterized protein LOC131230202 [Magnolia sinica]